jgi:four helix bundle protein
MRIYNDLKIYHNSHSICIDIYKLTEKFPQKETFGLTSQLRRASVSVVANIVEGSSRDSDRELKHFINIAIGSLSEVEALLRISKDLEYVKEIEYDKLSHKLIELRKMITRFKKSIK